MTREELSRELVKLRERAGFKTANSVCKKIGFSPNYTLQMEAGVCNFKLDSLFKYLKVVRTHLFLTSKDGDAKKNRIIKKPGILSQYISQMLRLQCTNSKNIAHKGMRGYMVNKIVNGDLSVGVDTFLLFLDLLGYDVTFQSNEVMEVRAEAAKKAEEDKYKPLSDDDVIRERVRLGKTIKSIRKTSGKKCNDITSYFDKNMQSLYALEEGDKNYMIETLFTYMSIFNINVYAVNMDEKIAINIDNIGGFIKKERERIEHASVLIANRLRISNDTITRIEKGGNFTINNCIQLLNYFGYKITIE